LEEPFWEFLKAQGFLREGPQKTISYLEELNVLLDVGIPEVSLVGPVVCQPLTCFLFVVGLTESR